MNVALYRIFLFLYATGVSIASLFNPKARLWLLGRRKMFKKLRKAFKQNKAPVIWFHCASLGEFEQGRPLLEIWKKRYPSYKILLTFFSPSGYEVHKDYACADAVFYLPLDSKRHARKFIGIVRPDVAIFVKYEFWYFYLKRMKKLGIPVLLVSGIFRKDQPFFTWYGGFHRKMLQCFSHFFLQDEESDILLRSIHIQNTTITGDTRFDRVLEIAQNWTPVNKVTDFCQGRPVIVAGSTWDEDDKVLRHFVNQNADIQFIIAPHEVDEERIKDCLQIFPEAVLYSGFMQETQGGDAHILVIDNVGMLSRLYKYATICFVGGAFGEDGVHNVLEAAVYQKPVVYGPVFDKYKEAVELEECGAGFPVNGPVELEKVCKELLSDADFYQAACRAADRYVDQHSGATWKVLDYLERNILKQLIS